MRARRFPSDGASQYALLRMKNAAGAAGEVPDRQDHPRLVSHIADPRCSHVLARLWRHVSHDFGEVSLPISEARPFG